MIANVIRQNYSSRQLAFKRVQSFAEHNVSYDRRETVPTRSFETAEAVFEFEQKLTDSLPSTHDVDGYDAGLGTVNFFVYTDSPQAVLRNFRKFLGTNKVEKKARIAYREVEGETFTNIWPKRDEREFDYSY